jgi:hypothetical protein
MPLFRQAQGAERGRREIRGGGPGAVRAGESVVGGDSCRSLLAGDSGGSRRSPASRLLHHPLNAFIGSAGSGDPALHRAAPLRLQNRGENGLHDDSSRASIGTASGTPARPPGEDSGCARPLSGSYASNTARIHRRRRERALPSVGVAPLGKELRRCAAGGERVLGADRIGFMKPG